MRIEQYIQMIDYAIWEVIENGATLPKTQVVEGVIIVMPITTIKEKARRRLEVKARITLMMGIPNEHLLKFNSIKDAKQLLKSVEKIFGEKLSQEDVNQKLLRSLSPEWNTHAVVWRNKADFDTMSMDDLYNNLKLIPLVVNTAHEVSTASTQVNAAFSTNIDNLNDMEEMDLRWKMAMLTMRARSFLKRTGRKLTVNSNKTISFDKSNVECYNFHKRGHCARECIARRNQDNKYKESSRRSVPVEITNSTAFVSCDGLGGYDWSKQADEGPNYALMAISSSSNMSYLTNYEEIDGGYVIHVIKSIINTVIIVKIAMFVRAATTASSLEAEQDNGNINKTQSKATPNESSSQGTNSVVVLESSTYEESLGEDASKQRRIEAIDADGDITLVNDQDDVDNDMFYVNDLVANVAQDSTATTTITTKEITLAQALEGLKTSKVKVKGIIIQEQEEPCKSTTTIIPKQQSQDKGKWIMIEEPMKPKKKDQIRLDEEVDKRLQAEFDKKERLEREKAEQEANIALIET
nr:hypothetical protein [Tanacetum cinerariifolium]